MSHVAGARITSGTVSQFSAAVGPVLLGVYFSSWVGTPPQRRTLRRAQKSSQSTAHGGCRPPAGGMAMGRVRPGGSREHAEHTGQRSRTETKGAGPPPGREPRNGVPGKSPLTLPCASLRVAYFEGLSFPFRFHGTASGTPSTWSQCLQKCYTRA